MEYLLINKSTLQALCSSIGWQTDDGSYKLAPHSMKVLHTIDEELRSEDPTTRDIRISLGLSNIVERDLLRILEVADLRKDYSLIKITLKILVNLSLPPEWLLTSDVKALKNSSLSIRLKQLQKILLDTKKAFVKSPKATLLLIKSMRPVPGSPEPILTDQCEKKCGQSDLSSDLTSGQELLPDKQMIKDCLMIFRNLLHIPEKMPGVSSSGPYVCRNLMQEWQDSQKRIIWNLLVQGLDNSLLYLMNTPFRQRWTLHIVQLIALMYRDQPVNKFGQFILARGGTSDCSDDDAESDHTMSAQRSSSTSILSDSSSSKDFTSNSGTCKKNDSGFYQTAESERTCSDSSQLNSKVTHQSLDLVILEEKIEDQSANSDCAKAAVKGEKLKSLSESLKAQDAEECEDCSDRDQLKIVEDLKRTTLNENDLSQENASVHSVSVNQSNQTSGFSGSSEEDSDRRMHKVMKPHQRSGIKLSESDSSDDSDYKNKMAVRCHVKKSSINHQTKTSIFVSSNSAQVNMTNGSSPTPAINNSTKSLAAGSVHAVGRTTACSPSICMDAAIAAAFSRLKTANEKEGNDFMKMIAPWDKKRTCGSKSSSIGSESSTPSDNDIRSLLEEFTLKFLHNFFSLTVSDLSKDLLKKSYSSLGISNLLWLLGYFLKISNTIDLKFSHVSSILQTEMFGFLVFNGVMLNEEIEHAPSNLIGATGLPDKMDKSTSDPSFLTNNRSDNSQAFSSSSSEDQNRDETTRRLVRKLQLLVTALKEMIVTVSHYINKPNLDEDEKNSLKELTRGLAKMSDLKQFFLLLIRSYSPIVHPKCLLVEVITAHHLLLLLLDGPYKEGSFDMFSHLQQFSTIRVMEQYGRILEAFKTNSVSLNNAVLTVMHHVAGDLRNPECLFQPVILKTFSLIMETDEELVDSWEDLIEYVMSRFVRAAMRSNASRLINLQQDKPEKDEIFSLSSSTNQTRDATICSSKESITSRLSSTDMSTDVDAGFDQHSNSQDKDQLYWLFLQYEQTDDPISCIMEAMMEEQTFNISRQNLVGQLIERGLINEDNCARYFDKEDGLENKSHLLFGKTNETEIDSITNIASDSISNGLADDLATGNKVDGEIEEIEGLIEKISKHGFSEQLSWISDVLIDVCNVKMFHVKKSIPKGCVLQPVAYYCKALGYSTPIVPFNEKQELAMNFKLMTELLQKIGFLAPDEEGKVYFRIPDFFTPDIVYKIAARLSKVNSDRLFFKIEDILACS